MGERISILLVIIGNSGKSLSAKNEILRSLRSLRMTSGDNSAEVSTLNLEL
jgi:hypothetical protein